MRALLNQIAPADRDYLQAMLQGQPGIADRLTAIARRNPEERAKLVPAIMGERLDRTAAALGIPDAWRQTRAERAHDRARMAELFAPVKIQDPHAAAEWARADEVVRGIADHVVGDAKLAKADRQRIGMIGARLMFPKDRYGYLKTAERVRAGNSQMARWVCDTGKLQTLHRALHVESQIPALKENMDMVWARSGGGQIRSEAGKALRTKLVIQRANLHHNIGQPADYEAGTSLMTALAQTPGKEQLHANLSRGGSLAAVMAHGPVPTRKR